MRTLARDRSAWACWDAAYFSANSEPSDILSSKERAMSMACRQ